MEPNSWSSPMSGNVSTSKDVLAPTLFGWLIAIFLILVGTDLSGGLIVIGNDDAMRLVQVRDLIDGQG